MSSEEPELTESSANPLTFVNPKVEEEFELEVVVGNFDIYDDMLHREPATVQEGYKSATGTGKENRTTHTCQYPLSLKNATEEVKKEDHMWPALASKFSCLIGNLTWWTTEEDMYDAIRSIGVFDCLRVKFFENRMNGVSKGYCSCMVKSNDSLNLIYEHFSKLEVNGKKVQVKPDNKESATYFESMDISQRRRSQNEEERDATTILNRSMSCYGGSILPQAPSRFPPSRPSLPCYQNGGFRFGPLAFGFRYRGHPQPSYRLGGWAGNFYGQYHHEQPQQYPNSYQGWTQPNRPRVMQQGYFTTNELQPEEHLSPLCPPGSSPISTIQSPCRPFSPTTDPPLASSTPAAPHLNPDFLQRGFIPRTGSGNPTHASGRANGKERHRSQSPSKLTAEEYDEAMAKNRMVASSAISHAVKEAASGEFEDAIETLVTAISLLRHSKVASDDRVKILISSLKDTLEGIESRNHERKRSHSRRRASDHHRNRSHTRHHSSHDSYSHVRRDFREHLDNYKRECNKRADRDEYVPRMKRAYERSRSRESRRQDEYKTSRRSSVKDGGWSERERSLNESFSSKR